MKKNSGNIILNNKPYVSNNIKPKMKQKIYKIMNPLMVLTPFSSKYQTNKKPTTPNAISMNNDELNR